MQALLTHTKTEMKLFFREPIAVFFTLLLPGVMFVIMGKIFGTETYSIGDYFEVYIPNMIGIVIFATGFFAIGLQIVIDREKGVYKRLKGTPINPIYVFTALIVKGCLAVYLGVIEILILAKVVFDVTLSSTLFQFFIGVTLSLLAFLGLGFLVASISKRMQTAMAIGFIAMYPMMFLSGAWFPIDNFSPFWKSMSKLIPLTYANDMMRLGWQGKLYTQEGLIAAVVLFGILLVSAFIGVRFFRWDP